MTSVTKNGKAILGTALLKLFEEEEGGGKTGGLIFEKKKEKKIQRGRWWQNLQHLKLKRQ